MNREFLLLAKDFNPTKHYVGNWLMSEKLDGHRCYWDGGLTRGMKVSEVPFANRNKDAREHICTGLWSRYGKVIHAPDWWLDMLPKIPLDGELYIPLERGNRQDLASIVKMLKPDQRWSHVEYWIFDSPGDDQVFMPGRINNPNFKSEFNSSILEWVKQNRGSLFLTKPLIDNLDSLKEFENQVVKILDQIRLPLSGYQDFILDRLSEITDKGGEGLMLRNAKSIWLPKRVDALLKVKKLLDSEAVVVGYTWGAGKYNCMMGSLRVVWNGIYFDLSGFTDEERIMSDPEKGKGRAGRNVTDAYNPKFPIGTVVTFRYRELSRDGVPIEARYWRRFTEVRK